MLEDSVVLVFQVGEPTNLHFSVYSRKKTCFLTEEYILSLTEYGMPVDVDAWGEIKTIFVVRASVWVCIGILVCPGSCSYTSLATHRRRLCHFRRSIGNEVIRCHAKKLFCSSALALCVVRDVVCLFVPP